MEGVLMKKVIKISLNIISILLILFSVFLFGLKFIAYNQAQEVKNDIINNVDVDENIGLILKDVNNNLLIFDYNKKIVYLNNQEYAKIDEVDNKYIKTNKGNVDIKIDPRFILSNEKLKLKSVNKNLYEYTFDNENYNKIIKEQLKDFISEDQFKCSSISFNDFIINYDEANYSFGSRSIFIVSDINNQEYIRQNLDCFSGFCS